MSQKIVDSELFTPGDDNITQQQDSTSGPIFVPFCDKLQLLFGNFLPEKRPCGPLIPLAPNNWIYQQEANIRREVAALDLVRFPNPLMEVGWVSNTSKSGKFLKNVQPKSSCSCNTTNNPSTPNTVVIFKSRQVLETSTIF